MEYFDPFASEFWVTVGVASLCGGIVGLERQLRGRWATGWYESHNVGQLAFVDRALRVHVPMDGAVAALAIDPELFAPGAPRRIRADRAAGEAIP